MITSLHNPKIKWIRSLIQNPRIRREEDAFVIEGVRLAEEALAAGWQARLVLYEEKLSSRGLSLVHAYQEQGVPVEAVTSDLMQRISDTKTPQGILIVLRKKMMTMKSDLDFISVLDEIRDPGNLGTILRSAAATGVQAVFLSPDCTDPYSPKVLRAGMGAHFHLPVIPAKWDEIIHLSKQHRLKTYVAASGKGRPIFAIDCTQPISLILGGEAFGVGERAVDLADDYVHIPLHSSIESFNVSAAAAILYYEVMRQREYST